MKKNGFTPPPQEKLTDFISWDGNQLRNKKGEYLAHIKRINEANITFDPVINNYKVVLTEQDKRIILLLRRSAISVDAIHVKGIP